MNNSDTRALLRALVRKEEEQKQEVEQKKAKRRKEKEYLYFAYGSNMSIEQMASRCPHAEPMFKATLYNARLVFKTYADVVNEKKRRSFVQGAVFKITKSDMKALDRYEGYPKFYKKVRCVVLGPTDKYHEAFMYIMQPDVRELALPTEQYFNVIGQGYRDWNIPVTSLCRAWEDVAVAVGELEKMEVK